MAGSDVEADSAFVNEYDSRENGYDNVPTSSNKYSNNPVTEGSGIIGDNSFDSLLITDDEDLKEASGDILEHNEHRQMFNENKTSNTEVTSVPTSSVTDMISTVKLTNTDRYSEEQTELIITTENSDYYFEEEEVATTTVISSQTQK